MSTKVHVVKAMVFPVLMYGCESWTIKKAESQRIDTLNYGAGEDSRVRWTARRSNQSILKENNLEYSLEGVILKLQYFGHLMQRANSLGETLVLGKIEDKRRRGQQRMRRLDSVTESMDMNLSTHQEIMEDRGAWLAACHEVAKSWTQLSN